MKRILVPTDLSPNAECALRVAVDMASRANFDIILYHVFIPVDSPLVGGDDDRKAHNEKTEKTLLKRMLRLRKKVLEEVANVSISTIIDRGPFIRKVHEFSARHGVVMIIMGTTGASGIQKALIGSVAAKTARRSDVPVMLIPAQFEPAPLKQIVIASDYDRSDDHAIPLALTMAKLYDGTVKIVHLLNLNKGAARITQDKKDFEAYAYFMQRKHGNSRLKFQLLEIDLQSDKIATLQREVPYDLLIMVRRKRSFFQNIFTRSFTRNMACVTQRPLLVLPPAEKPSKPDKKETR